MPEVKNGDSTFPGRIYYLKNLSADKDLQIKASGSELIRFGGSLEAKKTINLFPGRYVVLIASNGTGNTTWDLNLLEVLGYNFPPLFLALFETQFTQGK